MKEMLQLGDPNSDTFDWRVFANCADADPDTFFPDPDDEATILAAKKICIGCPVTAQCVTFRQENDDYGIWADEHPRADQYNEDIQRPAQVLVRLAEQPLLVERACMMTVPVTSRVIRLAASERIADDQASVGQIASLLIDERPTGKERQLYDRRLELISELGGLLLDPARSYIDWYEQHQFRWPPSALNLLARFKEPIGPAETIPDLQERALVAVQDMIISPMSDRAEVTSTLIKLHGLDGEAPVPMPVLAKEAGIAKEQLKHRLARAYSYHRDKADKAA